MASSIVTLTRCSDYSRGRIAVAMERQFELLGGLQRFVKPGDSVLLKPNFIAPRSRRHATQTDPAVVLEAARLLIDFGARPIVGDSPAWSNVFACVGALKLAEPLKKMSVPVKQLDNPRDCHVGARQTNVGISSVALDADVIINLPKFKSHQQLTATFAIKNMFGCVAGKRKALWHFAKGGSADDFCELLIDIYEFLNPPITIIDGVIAMDGSGPIRGRARDLGWLIGGTDPVACETICAEMVGIEPAELPIVKTAQRIGFGCSDRGKIEIAGDDFSSSISTDFELPKLIPIRFSFLQVCKSVCKQILLLARATLKKMST
ncbi:MAG: hypothetical protein AMJ65_04785 [Phycisphaerae bacterium SG8_4]|nr:MAG: hypothetical protein AMJ65_04785 [Phycisphaerae bacterium SG8_4]